MDSLRLLAASAAAVAATALSGPVLAQSIELSQQPPERVGGDHYSEEVNRFWISRQDCLDDQTFVFDVLLNGASPYQLEVWASDGANCTEEDQRDSAVANCWQVFTADAPSRSSMEITIRAQDIARLEEGATLTDGAATAAACDQDIGTAGLNLTLYFMLLQGDNTVDSTEWTKTGIDLVGPAQPTNVTAAPAERQINVTWDFSDTDDWRGWRIFCVPETAGSVDPSLAPSLRPQANGHGGAGGSGGASLGGSPATAGAPSAGGSSGAATGTTGVVPDECKFDTASILVEGEIPDNDLLENYSCGSGTSQIDDEGRATGLQNGVLYQVAVAGEDEFENVGPLSNVHCATPEEVDTFFEEYKRAGGEGGGGFCAFSPKPTSGSLALLGGAALVLAARRRRRRHG